MIDGASLIQNIPNVTRNEDFRDIVLIGHSYDTAVAPEKADAVLHEIVAD